MNLRTIARGDNPVTQAAAYLHLKLDTLVVGGVHPDDALVTRLRSSARTAAEVFLQRRVAQDVVELRVPAFARVLRLPLAPVASVAWLKYLDANEVEQTFDPANYTFIDDPAAPHLLLDWATWPAVADRSDAVRMRFTAGYAPAATEAVPVPTAEVLPDEIASAMLMMMGTWYENRGSVNVGNIVTLVPQGAIDMLHPHRLELGV